MLRKQQLLHTSMGAVLDGHAEVRGEGRDLKKKKKVVTGLTVPAFAAAAAC